jgi:hypothetical protein
LLPSKEQVRNRATRAAPWIGDISSVCQSERRHSRHCRRPPLPRPGQWVRFILGSGVSYQKQIGVAAEADDDGELLYYETQVGIPGGSCNPNTLKRTYLRGAKFASPLDPVPVAAQVATSGTTLTRWGDIGGGQTQSRADTILRRLDAQYLYDDRSLRVLSRTSDVLPVPASSVYSGSADSHRGSLHAGETLHTIAEFERRMTRRISSSESNFGRLPAYPSA